MVGRPRSETARKAILKAALDLCERDGYQNVTLKGIADAAGVGRQTLYRWWQTKAQVMMEAAVELLGPELRSPPVSGDPRADLVAFLRETFALAHGVAGRVVAGLMAEAQADPVFAAEFREHLIGPRRQALRAVLVRGALPEDVDVELAVDLIFGAMWYRLLNRHAEVDKKLAEEIAALVARIR
ncbi:TetR/AcrR family transcriptional regulator [Nonomuraea rhizosphaerae]|uniref:TetR/AcrR family transcriptional regulator n=1 Tax=Nonomuraea rhizosphaerae TaxID=2665663 RepID=UPI001C5EAD65|nr:TetR/AcrR family transcriptional regulator [Nonomuraea rhizosphaerae]